MRLADFPIDVQWTDIDIMFKHLDFTYDEKRFAGFPNLVRELQANGTRYVNIVDPAISSTQKKGTYPPYDEGLRRNIFISKFNGTEPITGIVIGYCSLIGVSWSLPTCDRYGPE
jgi:lysosomal alpha-glucosidase